VTAFAPSTALRDAAALVFVQDLGSPELGEDDCHHLGDVLRLKPGELVVAADGAGTWRLCEFSGPDARGRGRHGGYGGHRGRGGHEATAAGRFALEITGPLQRQERRSPILEVAFSWAKGDRTEWAVAKLVELGVDRLTPLVADRTVARPDPAGAAKRDERLRRIVREAAMQSRRPFLPEVGATQSVDAVVARSSPSGLALAEPGGDLVSLATPLVLVGPEGGWSPRELALVDQKVSLGDGILRVETAAIAAGVLLTALRSAPVAPALAPVHSLGSGAGGHDGGPAGEPLN
jgi:16S rRNA (uracil1498-N3)-methyltransferase